MKYDFVIPVFADTIEVDFFRGLSLELKRAGFSVACLVTGRGVASRLQEVSDTYFLYDGYDAKRPRSPEELWNLERKHRLGSLRGFAYPERTYDWGGDYETLFRRAAHAFEYMERFVSAHSVGWFVHNVGAELLRRVISRVANEQGIGNAVFDFVPFRGRMTIASSELGPTLPPTTETVASAELEFASAFLERMLRERRPFVAASPLGFGLANLKGALTAITNTQEHPDVRIGRLVEERARRVVRRVAGHFLYEPMRANEKYVFFPLHLGNDSAVTVRAPQFTRQETLVEYIAQRGLPAGVKLYVKPHIGARDSFAVDMLRRIRSLENVRLIAPETNPHDVIAGSLFCVVINSTAGFEAILHGKAVLTVGSPFYVGHGLTVDVPNLMRLPEKIEEALTFVPPRPRLLRFIAQYYRKTFEGTYPDPTAENVARFAQALGELARPQPARSDRSA